MLVGHVLFEIQAIDRMCLNVYRPRLRVLKWPSSYKVAFTRSGGRFVRAGVAGVAMRRIRSQLRRGGYLTRFRE